MVQKWLPTETAKVNRLSLRVLHTSFECPHSFTIQSVKHCTATILVSYSLVFQLLSYCCRQVQMLNELISLARAHAKSVLTIFEVPNFSKIAIILSVGILHRLMSPSTYATSCGFYHCSRLYIFHSMSCLHQSALIGTRGYGLVV